MTANRPVIIAQVSDCHIGFYSRVLEGNNTRRLRAVIDRLCNGPNRPDLLLLSGDLTEHGDAQSYARLADLVAGCPFPVRLIPGNHDDRAALAAAFPDNPSGDGFIQFEQRIGSLRVLALDTLEPGRHGGEFCEVRADWLRARLVEDRETPVLIAMHHPPVPTGIGWLDCNPDAAWVRRFSQVIKGHSQVRAIACGHVHRPLQVQLGGVPVIVCPSSAAAASLDLSTLDPDQPDGRPMIVDEPAGYVLHHWDGIRLAAHFGSVSTGEPWATLAQFDETMQPAVRHMADERRGPA